MTKKIEVLIRPDGGSQLHVDADDPRACDELDDEMKLVLELLGTGLRQVGGKEARAPRIPEVVQQPSKVREDEK